jgi:hypothetical protein
MAGSAYQELEKQLQFTEQKLVNESRLKQHNRFTISFATQSAKAGALHRKFNTQRFR